MPVIVGIVIFLVVCYILENYWQWILGGAAVIGCLIGLFAWMSAKEKEERKRQQELATNMAQEKADREQQEAYLRELFRLRAQAIQWFEQTPVFLSNTEQWLARAQVDFTERAFAPFWDSIEQALLMIGRFKEAIDALRQHIEAYRKIILVYEGQPPYFGLNQNSVMSVSSADPVIGQLNAVVRQAQRDFQFATIYEQRKTNRILISGFETVAQAIYGIGDQVSSAIQSLSADTSRMLNQIEDANARFQRESQQKRSEAVTGLQDMKVLMERDSEDQRVRHERTIKKLDDIQHHSRSLV